MLSIFTKHFTTKCVFECQKTSVEAKFLGFSAGPKPKAYVQKLNRIVEKIKMDCMTCQAEIWPCKYYTFQTQRSLNAQELKSIRNNQQAGAGSF